MISLPVRISEHNLGNYLPAGLSFQARKQEMMVEKKLLLKMGHVSAKEARAFIDKYRYSMYYPSKSPFGTNLVRYRDALRGIWCSSRL